jgi:hypothetical protein
MIDSRDRFPAELCALRAMLTSHVSGTGVPISEKD